MSTWTFWNGHDRNSQWNNLSNDSTKTEQFFFIYLRFSLLILLIFNDTLRSKMKMMKVFQWRVRWDDMVVWCSCCQNVVIGKLKINKLMVIYQEMKIDFQNNLFEYSFSFETFRHILTQFWCYWQSNYR